MDILANISEAEAVANGELPAGFLFASFKNVGNVEVIINGVALAAGEAKSYPFIGKGYQAISYQVNNSRLRMMVIV